MGVRLPRGPNWRKAELGRCEGRCLFADIQLTCKKNCAQAVILGRVTQRDKGRLSGIAIARRVRGNHHAGIGDSVDVCSRVRTLVDQSAPAQYSRCAKPNVSSRQPALGSSPTPRNSRRRASPRREIRSGLADQQLPLPPVIIPRTPSSTKARTAPAANRAVCAGRQSARRRRSARHNRYRAVPARDRRAR